MDSCEVIGGVLTARLDCGACVRSLGDVDANAGRGSIAFVNQLPSVHDTDHAYAVRCACRVLLLVWNWLVQQITLLQHRTCLVVLGELVVMLCGSDKPSNLSELDQNDANLLLLSEFLHSSATGLREAKVIAGMPDHVSVYIAFAAVYQVHTPADRPTSCVRLHSSIHALSFVFSSGEHPLQVYHE
ncbi:hypothetical protein BU16DRAFT_43131 [Lophium mytilinum]|uniref:Uncharacterized protein n=1 Tax=Lophium mytilinum TaxID=390894 RepID=A0A6A6QQX2_9PEZI|nr:hypothetical protein BU16DRAFT_43131 [Lophium mytilinum]